MTFLPIAARELRVATRRRATYWNRSVAVLLATIVTLYSLTALARGANPAQAGTTLFSILARMAFLCCLFSGVFLTADCLSEEKREGTLGLLFLTDLNGYDVALGKLMVTSLSAFYGLLAIFPVLAVPILMGGVAFGEFWRVAAALLNTLIFSLAVGMIVSAVSWKEHKAMLMVGSLLVLSGMILPAVGGPVAWVSPRLAFDLAANGLFLVNPQQFGWALAAGQALSWGMLLWTSRIARRSWQTGEMRGTPKLKPASPGALPAARRAEDTSATGEPEVFVSEEEKSRGELLDQNPMEWLATRKCSNTWIWGSLAVFALGWFVVCLQENAPSKGSFVESFSIAVSLHGIMKFWIAWEASSRFYELRRSGTLESLLSTPLSLALILSGHFKSLFNQFIRPVVAVLVFDLFLMSWLASSPLIQQFSSQANWSLFLMLTMMGLFVADAWALGWLGLWLGLNARRSWSTAFGALARIILLPTVVFMAAAWTLGGILETGGKEPIAGIVLWGLIGACNASFFGLTAFWKLHTRFRRAAAQTPSRELSPYPTAI